MPSSFYKIHLLWGWLFNDNTATIINPYENINITVDGAHVSIISNVENELVTYYISGKTENGSINISSQEEINLTLSNAEIINPTGAAIDILQDVKATIYLSEDTENTLIDGTESSRSATITSLGDIAFDGEGKMTLAGYKKHGIASSKSIQVNNGTIQVTQAASDGIHAEEFVMNAGTVIIEAASDGIDAGGGKAEINGGSIQITSLSDDVKGIKCDSDMTVNGGSIDITVAGAQSKAFSSKQHIYINGGDIQLTASGNTVLESSGSGYDTSHCSAIKSKGDIVVTNGNLNINLSESNDGGKGLSADGNIIVENGTLTITTAGSGGTYIDENGAKDSYTACCIKSDGDISIKKGTIICKSTGAGGKGISADGMLTIGEVNNQNELLMLDVTTSGERFYVSGMGDNADYANPKAIKSEGNLIVNNGTITIVCSQSDEGGEGLESKSTLTINGGVIDIQAYDDCINASDHIQIDGGYIYCVSTGNDAIDSNGTLTITGGLVIANGTKQPEGGFDCDNSTFKITGGTIIGTGGTTSNPTTSVSTQYSIKYNGTPGNAICIKKSSGEIVLLYQIPTYSGSSSGWQGGGGPGGGGNNSMVLLFSDPLLTTGSYTLSSGGSISGGTTTHGYNTGGSYTGGSSRTFTINSKLTTVN